MTSDAVPSTPAIALDKVTVERGARPVLKALSLVLPAGGFVVVLGPNGAGKSTFLRTVLGEFHPTSGTLRVFGQAPSELSWHAAARLRRRIGLMPQLSEHATGAPLSVREVVEIGCVFQDPFKAISNDDRRACEHWLTRFRLTALADRSYFSLSGGEQRKVHLARLFAQEAELLLLDEPAGHLDLPAQDALLTLLTDAWRETGRTTLVVTHELRHIPPQTTHVCMLRQGALLAYGHPGDVLTDAHISELYGEPLELVLHRGRYLAFTNGRNDGGGDG